MKVYVVVDHVCEADIIHGVFSSRAIAKVYIRKRRQCERFAFEGVEICEEEIDSKLKETVCLVKT